MIENAALQYMRGMSSPMQSFAGGYAQGQALGQRDRALDLEESRLNAAQMSQEQAAIQEAQKKTVGLAIAALGDPSGQMLKDIQSRGGLQGIRTGNWKESENDLIMLMAQSSPELMQKYQEKKNKAPDWRKIQQGEEYVYQEAVPGQGYTKEVGRGPARATTASTSVNVSPTIYGEGAIPTDKPTTTKIQQQTFNAQESLARLKGIKAAYKPEFLTFGGNIRRWMATAKDFLGGEDWLSDEDKRVIDESTKMMRRTMENLSLFIKDISGAAVSEQEAKRLSQALPNPDDSPREFHRKLTDAIDQVNASLWRYNYALRKGLDPMNSGVSLWDMDSIIDSEGQRIEGEVSQAMPQASQQEIDTEVQKQLTEIFGQL